MAITELYVRADAAGGGNGTTDANSGANGAFTWAEFITAFNALAPAGAATRFNVKSGTYSLAASTTLTGDGTPTYPIIVRGYNATPGDLLANGHAANGSLVTTSFPVLSYGSGYRLAAAGADYTLWETLKVVGTVSNCLFDVGAHSSSYRCYADNSSTNANASGLGNAGYNSNVLLVDCESMLSGGSGGLAALYGNGAGFRAIVCRVLASSAVGIKADAGGLLVGCVIKSTGHEIDCSATSTGYVYNILNCTTPNGGACGINFANAANTGNHAIIGNHITGCADAVKTQYSTSARCAFFANNRRRDNTNDITGFGDWALATDYGAIGPTTTGDDSTDYVNAGSGDYRLVASAPGKGSGLIPYSDIGGLQRQEPVMPALSSVLTSETAIGEGGAEAGTYHGPEASEVWHDALTGDQAGGAAYGTKTAASLAVSGGRTGTLEAQDIVDGVIVDAGANQIEGSATGGSTVIVVED